LGLFISRYLVKSMGGSEINLVSSKGKGTTFLFYIDMKKCKEQSCQFISPSSSKIEMQIATEPGKPPPKIHPLHLSEGSTISFNFSHS